MTAKEKLLEVVGRLTEAEAEAALRYLTGDSTAPVAELFDRAPEDDEESSAAENASAAAAWGEYQRGDSVSLHDARRELA